MASGRSGTLCVRQCALPWMFEPTARGLNYGPKWAQKCNPSFWFSRAWRQILGNSPKLSDTTECLRWLALNSIFTSVYECYRAPLMKRHKTHPNEDTSWRMECWLKFRHSGRWKRFHFCTNVVLLNVSVKYWALNIGTLYVHPPTRVSFGSKFVAEKQRAHSEISHRCVPTSWNVEIRIKFTVYLNIGRDTTKSI